MYRKCYLIETLRIALTIPAAEFTELREKLVFDAKDAGMTVYVCCRYENEKEETGQ
jgi:hypothetical protein